MKYKFIGLLLAVCFVATQVSAQALTPKEVVGNWKVADIHLTVELSEEEAAAMEVLRPAFMQAEFFYGDDQQFTFNFAYEEMKLEDGYWRFMEEEGLFGIWESEEKSANDPRFMGMQAFKKDGKILFMLEETPLALEVVKQ